MSNKRRKKQPLGYGMKSSNAFITTFNMTKKKKEELEKKKGGML